MKRRKIWVGLGTAVLVTSQVAAHEETPLPIPSDGVAPAGRHAAAAHRHGAAVVLAAKAKAGGEGGEGGEGAKASYDAGLKPAVRFYRNIELIRGHLSSATSSCARSAGPRRCRTSCTRRRRSTARSGAT